MRGLIGERWVVWAMVSEGLFSVFLGLGLIAYSDSLYFRIASFLILISVIIYLVGSIFIFRLKIWARRSIIVYSSIIIAYLAPFVRFLFLEHRGFKSIFAALFLLYLIFPSLFIIILTRPKVKEQFR